MNSKHGSEHDFTDPHHDHESNTIFGFWVYLMTDFMMFGALFAAYAVLQKGTFGGPSPRDLFNLPFNLVQTLVLLLSSLTASLAGVCVQRYRKKGAIAFFLFTFLLGIAFMGMQFSEFSRLIEAGNGWQRSAFLSSFFTLTGTFGLHVLFALLWILVLLPPVFADGLNVSNVRRLTCLKMFWQFLNVVWILIFLIVYLLGVI